jgi:hypothetical protein
MKHKALSGLAVAATLILTSTSALVGPPTAVADPAPATETVLVDHFEGNTAAQFVAGDMHYATGPAGFGRAADFTAGNWVRYNVPGWYQWTTTYDPTGKQGTVEFWVYPKKYGTSLLDFNWNSTTSSPPAGHILGLGINPEGKLTGHTWSSILGNGQPQTQLPVGNTTLRLNKWTHVAFTWGDRGTRLYVNGAIDAATPTNLYPALNPTFYVYLPQWGEPNVGNIDELKILNTESYWTLSGFFPPVRNAGKWNTVKGGSTVPLKFIVLASNIKLRDPAVVESFTVHGIPCSVGATAADDVPFTATGGTTLRYAGHMFIRNWKTPKKPGACYLVTMTTVDGSSLSARFALR